MSKLGSLKDRIIKFGDHVTDLINQRGPQRFATAVNEVREPSPFKSTGINDNDDMVPISFGSQRFANAIGYGPTVDQLNQFHARRSQKSCNDDDVCGDVLKLTTRVPDFDSAA